MKRQEWNKRFAVQFAKVSNHPQRIGMKIARASNELFDEGLDPEEAAEAEYEAWVASA